MSNKRRQTKHQAYRSLKDAGIDVSKHNEIRFNSGSETVKHAVGKLLVGYVGQINGYWVSSECECNLGEVDVVLFGHPERMTYAVELETGWDDTTLYDKQERYVHQNEPIDDLIAIEVNEIPVDMIEAAEYVADCLGLEL